MLKKVALPLLAALVLPLGSAQATDITFTINGIGIPSTYTQTEGGITMTWTNATSGLGGFTFGTWYPEEGFLTLGGDSVTAFDFAFDTAVTIVSYTVGAVNPETPTGKSFTLSAPGSTSSASLSLDSAGTFNIANGFSIGAGVTGAWTTSNMGGSYEYPEVTIQSITVRAVPEPGTYILLAGAAAGFELMAYRRRQAKLAIRQTI